MNKVGIKIDLSTFFEDERKMVFIMVDSNWESVECLQKRVEYLFEVDSVRFLSNDGYFLPPQESIEIVKFCKGLKAFVPKESMGKQKKKKSKKSKIVQKTSQESGSEENYVYIEEQDNSDSQKKRKYCILESDYTANVAPKYVKRLKNCCNISERLAGTQYTNKSGEISSTSEQIPLPQQLAVQAIKKKIKTKQLRGSTLSSDNEDIETVNKHQPDSKSVDKQTVVDSVKKRGLCNEETNDWFINNRNISPKEKVKSTNVDEEETFNDGITSITTRPSSILTSTFLNESEMLEQTNSERCINLSNSKDHFKTQSSKNHIYFNESGEIINTSSKIQSKDIFDNKKESTAVVIFRCPLQDVTNNDESLKPRIFHIKPKISNNDKKKQILEIREDIVLAPIPNLADLNKNSTRELIATVDIENKEKIIEITKTDAGEDLVNEKRHLDDKTNIINGTTTIVENVDQTSDNNLENSQNENKIKMPQNEEESPSSKSHKSLQPEKSINESSIVPVDCVDLSIDLEEDDIVNKTIIEPKLEIDGEKHDLTKDEHGNESSSDVEEVSEIIDLNETEDNCESIVNNSKAHSHSIDDIRVDKILPFCNKILISPNINDIIVFKMAYINKKQQAAETNYLAGKVEYINKRTKIIKILIIDGLTELWHIPNRFVCSLDNSQDGTKYLQLKFNDMIEPKLFSDS